jgi:RNA polymerase primary sigma factor
MGNQWNNEFSEENVLRYFKDVKESETDYNEEIELFKKIKKGDKKSRDLVLKKHLRFVIKVAKTYKGCGLPIQDIIGFGNLGLVKAIDTFDINKNCSFLRHAYFSIKGEILNNLRQHSNIIRIPTSTMRKNKDNKKIYSYEYDLVKLYNVLYSDSDGNYKSADYDILLYEKDFFYNKLIEKIELLSDEEKDIIKKSYGIKCKKVGLNDLCKEYGTHRPKIVEIRKNGLRKLRYFLADDIKEYI